MTSTHTQDALSYADFIDGPDGETATLSTGGYTVTLWRDSDAPCPWDDWSAMLPWFNRPARNQRQFDYGSALDITANMPDKVTWRQFRAVLRALDIPQTIDEVCYLSARIDSADYATPCAAWRDLRLSSLSALTYELIREADLTSSDLDTIEALYNALGVPCESFSTQGYSQGDYVDGLFVATPQWIAETGLDPETCLSPEEVATSKKLLSAWLWGDVWGFTIVREGEYVDSCGGFYTGPLWSVPADSYIFDVITDVIEADKRERGAV